MSIKTVTNKVTSKVGKQMLVAQKHSPAALFAVGLVGVGTTVFLACKATLKLSDVLDEGEEKLKKVESDTETEVQKKTFGVQLQLAIKIAKLYAPAAIVGVASVGAITGSHVILKKRNAALTAAYAIVNRSFKDYRGRVIADQGPEKDLEYRFGTTEREIVEEGPNGPEVKTVRGLDQKAIQGGIDWHYARIFDESNPNWSDVIHQNKHFIQMVLNHARDLLEVQGFVFLNDVYDMLGFDRTKPGQMVGWVKKVKTDPVTGKKLNDGYIDFGVWNDGIYKGKEWVNGDPKAILLDFNVDGIILDELEMM